MLKLVIVVSLLCLLATSASAENLPAIARSDGQLPAQAEKRNTEILTDAAVIAAIIALSRAAYPGSCGCPDNTDSIGRRCGGRSAYSRAGGRFVYCYDRDVTPDMVHQYRAGKRQLGR